MIEESQSFADFFNSSNTPEEQPEQSVEQPETEELDSRELEMSDDQSTQPPETLDSSAEQQDSSTDEVPAGPSEDIEVVSVKDINEESGRREIKIDYTDKKAIKKAHLQAAGMRLFQAQKDKIKQEWEQEREANKPKLELFETLDTAFKQDGARGVLTILGNNDAGFVDEFVDSVIAERERIKQMSPEEQYRLREEKRKQEFEQQLAQERKKREEFESKISEKEFQAGQAQLEAQISPIFERYSLTGKLGDPVAEQFHDENIWDRVRDRLAEYPEEQPLTRQIIEKEVRTVANHYQRFLTTQASNKANNIIKNKKTAAAKSLQAEAKKGVKSSPKNDIMKAAASGNLAQALNMWSRRNR